MHESFGATMIVCGLWLVMMGVCVWAVLEVYPVHPRVYLQYVDKGMLAGHTRQSMAEQTAILNARMEQQARGER